MHVHLRIQILYEYVETIIDYNECNDTPLSNENIRDAIHKVIKEEVYDVHNITTNAHRIALDSQNITTDASGHTSNTQRENANEILTSEKLYKLGMMAEK